MEKIQLELVNIIPSQTSFHIVLKEKYGTKRLPITIGFNEGRLLSWALENITINRPLTHDLLISIIEAFDIEIKELIITKIYENIFYAELVLEKNGAIIKIDARPSDGIILAVKKGIPIYAYRQVLDEAGIEISVIIKEAQKTKKDKLEEYSLTELEELLQKAIDEENYEYASLIRDEIKRRKNQKS